jgi:alcohol dehydrogenase class IV
MWTFTCPTIVYGDNALDYILEIKHQKAFIVTDQYIMRLGLAQRLTEQLDAAEIQWSIFDATGAINALESIQKGRDEAFRFQPSWVIGLGGTSCINAAKEITKLLHKPATRPKHPKVISHNHFGCKPKFMAIPTNSGNGAEDAWDIMKLKSDAPSEKINGYEHARVPDVAILDPEMIVLMPPRNTADHGMDTICKAIEGYVSTWGSSITDGPALIAIRQAFANLPNAYSDGKDLNARMEMQHAAFLAELSAGNAMAGLGFSAGRALRTAFNLPRGRAVGLLLPYTMEYIINGSLQTTLKYAEIARFCGAAAGSNMDCAYSLVKKIRNCAKEIQQPLTIKACGILEDEFEAAIDDLVEKTLNEIMTRTILRVPDTQEMAKIFRYAYTGQTVDF